MLSFILILERVCISSYTWKYSTHEDNCSVDQIPPNVVPKDEGIRGKAAGEIQQLNSSWAKHAQQKDQGVVWIQRKNTTKLWLLGKHFERAKHGDPFHERPEVPPTLGAHFQYCMRRKGEKDAKFTCNQPLSPPQTLKLRFLSVHLGLQAEQKHIPGKQLAP